MITDHQLTPYTKINSRWIKDLNISHDTIKVLEENIGKKISAISHSSIFTDMSPRARDIKERINKWDLIKIKREPTVRENIFANDTSDKGLISKIYKGLTQLHSKKTRNPVKKWAKDLNRHFSKEDIQRVQRHMKRCSVLLAIREMQIKTTMRYHVTPVRMAIKIKQQTSVGEVVEKREPTIGGNTFANNTLEKGLISKIYKGLT